MSAATIRAEIKIWEREFKQRIGREPTVQDIKQQPAIADKYKLYKNLSKSQTEKEVQEKRHAADVNAHNPMSTPTRSTAGPRPASLLPKSQVASSSIPATTSNPFSPVKDKRKASLGTLTQEGHALPVLNPFTTPLKGKAKAVSCYLSSPEPHRLTTSQQQTGVSPGDVPVLSSVTKARKRLRGDPVSPSPQRRDKKRRTSPRTIIRPPSAANILSDSDSEGNLGETQRSYLDDSPVKPPNGGNDFKLLFEETIMNVRRSPSHPPISRLSFFGEKDKELRDSTLVISDRRQPSGPTHVANEKTKPAPQRDTKHQRSKGLLPKWIIPGHDDMGHDSPHPSLKDPNKQDQGGDKGISRPGRKRSSSTAGEHIDVPTDRLPENHVNDRLLPPSPPPAGTTSKRPTTGYPTSKGKGVDRKRARLETPKDMSGIPEEVNDGDIVEWHPPTRSQTRGTNPETNGESIVWDNDTILVLSKRNDTAFTLTELTDGGASNDGSFDVDVPDNLLKVLAISPSHRARHREEKAIVDGLLYGQGDGQIGKGAEVYSVGDLEETMRTDDEDEWAGEGVPWEVGEL